VFDGFQEYRIPTGDAEIFALASSPLEVWRPWADHLSDLAIDCGHFIAEEQPAACADALLNFFVH
jgi:pimeloyl-ACP methyl ester carboxylesterase